MSRTFSDSLESDVESIFLNVDEFARPYTLSRGQSKTAGVPAIVANRQYDATDNAGGAIAFAAIDLDIAASAYEIGGVAVDPRPGDRLQDAGNSEMYEVLPIAGGRCFEPSEDGLLLSVHCKRVGQ